MDLLLYTAFCLKTFIQHVIHPLTHIHTGTFLTSKCFLTFIPYQIVVNQQYVALLCNTHSVPQDGVVTKVIIVN